MTDKEAIYIKTFLEGAFPMLKESKESDLTYAVMLKEFDFETMFQATKNYIKKSVYTPTIAGLILEYEVIKKTKEIESKQRLLLILEQMKDSGVLQHYEYKPGAGLSEFERAFYSVENNKISESLKEKIMLFSKKNEQVKLLLESVSKRGEKIWINTLVLDVLVVEKFM